MEIHAPDHPITGWNDAAKHLAIITVGVCIALALEGIVSWADHRLLVREATANVIAELRTNRKELDSLFASLEQEKAQLEHADEVADLLLAHKPLDHISMALESHGAELTKCGRDDRPGHRRLRVWSTATCDATQMSMTCRRSTCACR